MIKIVLSELDFDYELQALVNSFFSGQRYMFSNGKDYDWSVLQ